MQDLPEKSLLLDAIAAFLDKDLRPSVQHPGLAFRVRIAAHLAQVIAREIRSEDGDDLGELAALAALLDRPAPAAPPTRAERSRLILEARRDLAAWIRTSALDDPAIVKMSSALRKILAAKLAVAQPKFDTRLDIE